MSYGRTGGSFARRSTASFNAARHPHPASPIAWGGVPNRCNRQYHSAFLTARASYSLESYSVLNGPYWGRVRSRHESTVLTAGRSRLKDTAFKKNWGGATPPQFFLQPNRLPPNRFDYSIPGPDSESVTALFARAYFLPGRIFANRCFTCEKPILRRNWPS